MDPETLPRPGAGKDSIHLESRPVYDSDQFPPAPSSASSFVAVDSGSTSFRHARLSTNHVPAWPSMQLTCGLPLGCIFQPFAEPEEQEESVPMGSSSSSDGPIRCCNCSAFVNAHFMWEDEGLKVQCNLCLKQREVPSDYYSPINGMGVRQDRFQRVELFKGSVDFVPPPDIVYSSTAPVTIFVIDCSHLAVSSGFLAATIRGLRLGRSHLPLETEIAFILFDESMHFVRFELSRNGSPSLVSVSDVDDPFIPDPSLCVSPHLLSDQLEMVFDLVLAFAKAANPNRAVTCANAALSIAADLAAERGGGSVVLFQASASKLGLGKCADTVPSSIVTLHASQEDFLEEMVKNCSENHVCVDFFAFAHSPVNLSVQAVATIVHKTGGEFHLVAVSDLIHTIGEWVKREKFFNCVLRIRASKGLAIESIDVARSTKSGVDSMALPRMSSQSVITTTFSVSETADQNTPSYLQLACLYTRSDGVRLIRVHNVTIRSTSNVTQVFKFADPETITLLIAKSAISTYMDRPEKFPIRETVMQNLVKMLHAYRVNCASNTASGQLILPDSLKNVPLMLSGMLKQVGIRDDKSTLDWDAKIFGFFKCLHATVKQSAFMFLSRIMCIHPLVSDAGRVQGGVVTFPPLVPASREKLAPSRIYLIDRGHVIIVYVGREVVPDAVETLLGAHVAQMHVERKKVAIFEIPASVSTRDEWPERVHVLLDAISRSRKNVRLKCLLGSSSIAETTISNLMIEDRIGAESGYVDWLCLIHRLIQEKIDY